MSDNLLERFSFSSTQDHLKKPPFSALEYTLIKIYSQLGKLSNFHFLIFHLLQILLFNLRYDSDVETYIYRMRYALSDCVTDIYLKKKIEIEFTREEPLPLEAPGRHAEGAGAFRGLPLKIQRTR